MQGTICRVHSHFPRKTSGCSCHPLQTGWPVIINGFGICYVKCLCLLPRYLNPVVEIWIILCAWDKKRIKKKKVLSLLVNMRKLYTTSGADPEGGFGDLSPLNFLHVKMNKNV